MVKLQFSKLLSGVRFPHPAPTCVIVIKIILQFKANNMKKPIYIFVSTVIVTSLLFSPTITLAQTSLQPQPEKHQSFFQSLLQSAISWIFGHDTEQTKGTVTVTSDDLKNQGNKGQSSDKSKWLTYSDFGFSIKYPDNLNKETDNTYYCAGRVDCGENGDTLYIYNYTADKSEYDKLKKNLAKNEFRIRAEISVENGKINLDSIVPVYNEAHNKIINQRTILNGFNVAVIKNEWGFPITYYIVNKNVKVIIYVAYKDVDQNTKNLIQDIVSSLSFTN